MEMTKRQAALLLFECSTSTMVIGGEEGEEITINNKMGTMLRSHGIDATDVGFHIGYMKGARAENLKKAGEFLKEWGELLLSEEEKPVANPGKASS